jgi:histone H3/H4
MVRVKRQATKVSTKPKSRAQVAGKVPRAGYQNKVAQMKNVGVQRPKKHRFRPGTQALREIRKYQKSTEILIKVLPFRRVVKEIALDAWVELTKTVDLRMQESANNALQQICFAFRTKNIQLFFFLPSFFFYFSGS